MSSNAEYEYRPPWAALVEPIWLCYTQWRGTVCFMLGICWNGSILLRKHAYTWIPEYIYLIFTLKLRMLMQIEFAFTVLYEWLRILLVFKVCMNSLLILRRFLWIFINMRSCTPQNSKLVRRVDKTVSCKRWKLWKLQRMKTRMYRNVEE